MFPFLCFKHFPLNVSGLTFTLGINSSWTVEGFSAFLFSHYTCTRTDAGARRAGAHAPCLAAPWRHRRCPILHFRCYGGSRRGMTVVRGVWAYAYCVRAVVAWWRWPTCFGWSRAGSCVARRSTRAGNTARCASLFVPRHSIVRLTLASVCQVCCQPWNTVGAGVGGQMEERTGFFFALCIKEENSSGINFPWVFILHISLSCCVLLVVTLNPTITSNCLHP